jgi:hypothetical protein
MNKDKKTVAQITEDARMRAKMITSAAKEQYQVEIDRLNMFTNRFNTFVNEIVNAYPSDKTRKLAMVAEMLKEILTKTETEAYTSKDKINEAYKLIDGMNFKPKGLYGESENGFNMDDVLNPKGELDLMAICKELGVTE